MSPEMKDYHALNAAIGSILKSAQAFKKNPGHNEEDATAKSRPQL